jgi:hypothetical protein
MYMTPKNRRAVAIPRSQPPGSICFFLMMWATPDRSPHPERWFQAKESGVVIIRLPKAHAQGLVWKSACKEPAR